MNPELLAEVITEHPDLMSRVMWLLEADEHIWGHDDPDPDYYQWAWLASKTIGRGILEIRHKSHGGDDKYFILVDTTKLPEGFDLSKGIPRRLMRGDQSQPFTMVKSNDFAIGVSDDIKPIVASLSRGLPSGMDRPSELKAAEKRTERQFADTGEYESGPGVDTGAETDEFGGVEIVDDPEPSKPGREWAELEKGDWEFDI